MEITNLPPIISNPLGLEGLKEDISLKENLEYQQDMVILFDPDIHEYVDLSEDKGKEKFKTWCYDTWNLILKG